jgi:DNA processing protein
MRMERAAWVALSAVKGLGPARFRRLLDEHGSALAVLDSDPQAVSDFADLPESSVQELAEAREQLERISDELTSLDDQGMCPLIWEDADYPSRLLSISSPPPVLWQTGAAHLSCAGASVAVVGSRQISAAGAAVARTIADILARAGVTVVSGLADGIDAAAHEATLDADGLTVGVCGCGLLAALGQGHDSLAGRVAEAGGLCSELAPTAPLFAGALFARDRIIAGLVTAVIVVEARAGGGAVHTAKCAMQEGRAVLAVKWADGQLSPGSRELLAAGAVPVEEPEEIRSLLRLGDRT